MAHRVDGRRLGLSLAAAALIVAAGLLLKSCSPKAPEQEDSEAEGTKMTRALGDLETGTALDLQGGTCREHPLTLPAGHFIQVAVEQLGIDLAVRLRAADGSLLVEVDSPIGDRGHERLSAVAEESGGLLLAVCSDDAEAEPGQYRLSVEADRPATADDRRLVAAVRVFAEGEELRRRKERSPAIDRYREALEVFRSVGDERRQAEALHRIGWLSEDLRRLEEALEADLEAVELFEKLGERHRQGVVLSRLGTVRLLLGDAGLALTAHQEALGIALELGDRVLEVGVLNNIGLDYTSSHQFQRAIEAFREALESGRGTPDEATVWHNLGGLLMDQGRYEEAFDALDRARTLKRAAGNATPANTLNRLGDVLQRLGRPDEAIGHLEQALEARRRRGSPASVAFTLNNLANALLKADRLDEALERGREAVSILEREAGSRDRATALMNLGRIHLHHGEIDAAETRCDQARRLFESIGDRWGEAASRHGLAQALHARKAYREALGHLEAAVDRVEDLRAEATSQRFRMSYFATKQSYYELLVDVLMHLAEEEPDAARAAGYVERAVQVSERGRARSLLEMLAETPDDRRGDPQLAAREKELKRQLNGLAWAQAEAEAQGETTGERVRSLEKRLRAVLLELDTVRERIRGESPAYAELTQPRPLTLEEIRDQVVDPDTLLLIYSLGEERSFLWCVSAQGMTSHVLRDRRRIERAAARASQSLVLEHRAENRAADTAALSKLVLGPVADQLDRKRLAIVAEGGLLDVSFAALSDPAGGRLLLADHEIVYLPSASVAATLRRAYGDRSPAPGWLAAVADPVFDSADPRFAGRSPRPPGDSGAAQESTRESVVLRSARSLGLAGIERLEASADEVHAIAEIVSHPLNRLFLDFDARREAVAGDALSPYRIVHFATHGLVNRAAPELSGLVLSLVDEAGEPQDGFLRAHEIYDLELSAELVVLSACETGLGKEVSGEGQLGLTRGFMYAGAPRVVVSRWRVGDRATAELMERFYFGMIEQRLAPAAALRCAQLSMQAEEEWQDPHHWAGFVLEGEWRSIGAMGGSVEAADSSAHEEDKAGSDMPIPDGGSGTGRCEQMVRAWKDRASRRGRRRDDQESGEKPEPGDSLETADSSAHEEDKAGSDMPMTDPPEGPEPRQ